jgi:hypothetical protein
MAGLGPAIRALLALLVKEKAWIPIGREADLRLDTEPGHDEWRHLPKFGKTCRGGTAEWHFRLPFVPITSLI